MSATPPELVIAGNLLVDDITLADGRTLTGEPGGALLHAALAAALWGVRVGLVSVLGDDYPRAALDALVARGVDLAGARPGGTRALRTRLTYAPEGRRMLHPSDGPTHAEVSPHAADVPAAWWAGAIVHVAPMPRAIQLEYPGRGARELTADPHEPVVPGDPALGPARFAGFDGVFVSGEESALPGEERAQAAAIPARRFVALKLAGRGGLVLDRDTARELHWAPRVTRVVDTTGAGDAFAAGFLAGRARGEPIEGCCQRGVVSASFALEDWGARGLLAADRAAAERRLAEWFGRAPAGG